MPEVRREVGASFVRTTAIPRTLFPRTLQCGAYSRADRADDATLLAGVAVGDEDATTAFVRRYQARVFGLALSITRDRGLAEDVSQEAFVRAWRAAGGYDGRRGSALTWLLTITRNLSIDVVRARRLLPVDADALERLVGETLADDPRAPEHAATIEIESARARARLREIPPHRRARSCWP